MDRAYTTYNSSSSPFRNPLSLCVLDQDQKLVSWLKVKRNAPYGADYNHTNLLKAFLTAQSDSLQTARSLLTIEQSRPIRSDSAWRLWTLLFDFATELPETHDKIINLILTIRQIDVTITVSHKLRTTLWSNWGDRKDMLWAWRSLEQNYVNSSLEVSGPDRRINFCAFTAKFVGEGDEECRKACGVSSFFDLRDVLEVEMETYDGTMLANSTISANEMLSCDVETASQWVRYAGHVLYSCSNEFFGDGWAAGFAVKTDLWSGAPGFSAERWDFWRIRFAFMSESSALSENARSAARAAATVIEDVSTVEARAP